MSVPLFIANQCDNYCSPNIKSQKNPVSFFCNFLSKGPDSEQAIIPIMAFSQHCLKKNPPISCIWEDKIPYTGDTESLDQCR